MNCTAPPATPTTPTIRPTTPAGGTANTRSRSFWAATGRGSRSVAASHPQAVSRSELIKKIWHDQPTDSDALRSHIYQLRSALDKQFEKQLIKTVHSVGFRLEL